MKKNPNVESLYVVDVAFEVLLLVTVDVLVLADDRPKRKESIISQFSLCVVLVV